MKDLEKQIEDAAKDYADHEIKANEEKDSNFMTMVDAVKFGAKSNAAKEFHQQGMFSPEDMIAFGDYCYNEYAESPFSFRELLANWIEQNKKK